jgi:hypothetical protein
MLQDYFSTIGLDVGDEENGFAEIASGGEELVREHR